MTHIRYPFRSLRALSRLACLAVWTELALMAMHVHTRGRSDRLPLSLRYGQLWARWVLRALGVRVEREGHVPAERVLVVANHRSYIDIPILLAALPCAFLAKHEVASWPLFGRAAGRLRTVFVKRECRISRRAAREAAGELLSRGVSFAAFPEGTTSGGPGIQAFFPGLFQLAAERGFPVLPVAICYADREDAFVDSAEFVPHFLSISRKRRVRVEVRFGPVLRPDAQTDLRAQAEAWIAGALARLEAPHAPSTAGVAETRLVRPASVAFAT